MQTQLKHGSAVSNGCYQARRVAIFWMSEIPFPNADERQLLEAIQFAVDAGADVINPSLGRSVPFSNPSEHIASCSVCNFVSCLAAQRDILVVVAVGNWGTQAIGCPALASEV